MELHCMFDGNGRRPMLASDTSTTERLGQSTVVKMDMMMKSTVSEDDQPCSRRRFQWKRSDMYMIQLLLLFHLGILAVVSCKQTSFIPTYRSPRASRSATTIQGLISKSFVTTIQSTQPTPKSYLKVTSQNNNDTSTKSSSTTTTKQSSSHSYTKWLEQKSDDILDKSRIPLGQLTSDDIETITTLMAHWAKKKNTKAALQVEKLLKRVVDDFNHGNRSVNVTTRMYTMAVDAWARTGSGKLGAERAHMIHEKMVERYRRTGDENIRPSTVSYNAVINAWSKSGCDVHAAHMAEKILSEMLEEWRGQNEDDDGSDVNEKQTKEDQRVVKPDVVSFTSVIDTWAKSGDKNGARRAMDLLKRMDNLYKTEGQLGMKPNVYTFSACINAFAKSNDPDAPKHAEALLDQMKAAHEAGDMNVKPNVVNYNSVINAWGRCKVRGSAQRATEILHIMERDGVEPDVLSYALVVSAWSHCPESDGTKRAEEYLNKMEQWAMKKNTEIDQAFNVAVTSKTQKNDGERSTPSIPAIRVHLDVECYNTVLIALSRRQDMHASDRAIAILNRMNALADAGYETVRPNAKSWNSVLNALSRSRDPNAAQRAEDILKDMFRQGIKPDVFSFAAILHAYQKNSGPGSAQRADDIVRMMERLYYEGEIAAAPDVYHYTIVCACWARSKEQIAASRCGQILRHMEERYQNGHTKCKPNVRTYNAVIDAYARGQHVEIAEDMLNDMLQQFEAGDKTVKPDGFTFNAVINAWTRSRRKGAGARAEIILQRLLSFHNDGNSDVRPDSRSFSHIIDYYSRGREPDAAPRAEWLLLAMIKLFLEGYNEVVPNIFTFTAVINAHMKSNNPDAGRHAERIVQYMQDLHDDHGLSKLAPNTFVMNALLHCWSKSGDPESGPEAEKILDLCEEKFLDGNYELRPNTRMYGLVLSCWAKSASPDKARRARNVLERMERASETNENVLPNVHCFNAVLNSAAFTEGSIDARTNAFEIATETLKKLLRTKTIEPISSTFGTYLKACGKLSLPNKTVESHIERTFERCCAAGLVNDFVLTQIRFSASPDQYDRLLGKFTRGKSVNERIDVKDIPSSWKKNVQTIEDDFWVR